MNNVCLVGRLTRDPELRRNDSGIASCSFTIAVDGRPNADGEKHTDFINLISWRNQAENISKYCRKGDMVGIVGRIQTTSYEAKDGTNRYITNVVVENIRFLSSKKNAEENNSNSNEPDPFEGIGTEVVLTDDDLPF